jgi:hypothetical protein
MSAARRRKLECVFRYAIEEAQKAGVASSQGGTFKWLQGLCKGRQKVIEELIETVLGPGSGLLWEDVKVAAWVCKPMLNLVQVSDDVATDLARGIDGWRAAVPLAEEYLEAGALRCGVPPYPPCRASTYK